MRLSPPSAGEPEPDLEYESDSESFLTQAGIGPSVSAVSEYTGSPGRPGPSLYRTSTSTRLLGLVGYYVQSESIVTATDQAGSLRLVVHQQSGECTGIRMQNVQNTDLSLFCILQNLKGFSYFIANSATFFAYFITYSAYFIAQCTFGI
jgi:hypothetical protein